MIYLRNWGHNSVQGIFTQYERLTKKSGLLLNADKTEILNLENNIEKVYEVDYMSRKGPKVGKGMLDFVKDLS